MNKNLAGEDLVGSGDPGNLSPGDDFHLLGSGSDSDGFTATRDTVNLGGDVSAGVSGSSDIIDVDGSGTALSTSGNVVNVFYNEDTETIGASNATIRLADLDGVDIVGNNDRIEGSKGDNVTVFGTFDTVSAANSAIDFDGSSNTGDFVDDNGDTGFGWAGTDGGTGGDTGLGTSFPPPSSGAVAAGAHRAMNVVGQYDLAHGLTDAAANSEAAWTRAQQAIAAATNPMVAPTSPFNGFKWSGPVITYSFATGPGPAAAPFSGSIQTQYQAIIEQAIQTWAAASGLTFQPVADRPTADIRIGWGAFDPADSGSVGYTNLGGAASGQAPDATVRLEDPADDSLIAGPTGALIYSDTNTQLYQTALHEIGHALGLGDNSDPNSIMFAALGPTNTALDAADLANLATLYPDVASMPATSTAQLVQAIASFHPPPSFAPALLPIPPPTSDLILAASTQH